MSSDLTKTLRALAAEPDFKDMLGYSPKKKRSAGRSRSRSRSRSPSASPRKRSAPRQETVARNAHFASVRRIPQSERTFAQRLTPGGKPASKGRLIQRGVPLSPANKALLREARAKMEAGKQAYLQGLFDGKAEQVQLNAQIARDKNKKSRHRAARNQLYGGAPLSRLFPGQRATAASGKKAQARKSLDPLLALQMYAQEVDMRKGGATSCAAALHAAKLANKGRSKAPSEWNKFVAQNSGGQRGTPNLSDLAGLYNLSKARNNF